MKRIILILLVFLFFIYFLFSPTEAIAQNKSTSSKTLTSQTHTISVTSGTNGSIRGPGKTVPAGTTDTFIVRHGETPTFTFQPQSGYQVSEVKINNISRGAITTYTFPAVISNQTLVVSFKKKGLIIDIKKKIK